MKQATRI